MTGSRSPYNFEVVLLDHGQYFDLDDELRGTTFLVLDAAQKMETREIDQQLDSFWSFSQLRSSLAFTDRAQLARGPDEAKEVRQARREHRRRCLSFHFNSSS
jgi:hypothetical protein